MRHAAIAATIAIATTTPGVVQAAPSSDECAIWLCLPYGFPTGCSDARKAMERRLLNFQSPIPRWDSCSVGDEAGPDLVWNSMAVYDDPELGLVLVDDLRCGHDRDPNSSTSDRCLGTVTRVEVYMDDQLMGEPYVKGGWGIDWENIPIVQTVDLTPPDEWEDDSPDPSGGDR